MLELLQSLYALYGSRDVQRQNRILILEGTDEAGDLTIACMELWVALARLRKAAQNPATLSPAKQPAFEAFLRDDTLRHNLAALLAEASGEEDPARLLPVLLRHPDATQALARHGKNVTTSRKK